MDTVENIEDLLHLVTGLKQTDFKYSINPSDSKIIYSIARQTFQGTALTDRQFNLMKQKMLDMQDQFIESGITNFQTAVESLKYPLRTINREQSIKLVDTKDVYVDQVYESSKEKWKWMKVRFPFSKKLIVALDSCNIPYQQKHHIKSTQVHFIRLTESNIFKLVSVFKSKNFVIQQEILDAYEEIVRIKEEGIHKYLPYYKDGKILNASKDANLDDKVFTELKAYDNRFIHQYYLPEKSSDGHLIEKIAYRKNTDVLIQPSQHNFDSIVESLLQLERFPLLVLIDEHEAYSQVTKVHKSLKYVFADSDQTVLFRVEKKSAQSDLNNYISENTLNNWLDKNTKVVYIAKNKLPKLLLKTDWKPSSVYCVSSHRPHTMVQTYCTSICDLIILHDERVSYFAGRNY